MSSRANDPIEISLDRRQVTGILTGSLIALAVVFALGVGFGQRLASAPPSTPTASDLKQLDDRPAAPSLSDTGFTFQQTLVKGDPNAVAASWPPAPRKTNPADHRVSKAPPAKPAPDRVATASPPTPPWTLTPPLVPTPKAPAAPSETAAVHRAADVAAPAVVTAAAPAKPASLPPAAVTPIHTAPALRSAASAAAPAGGPKQRSWCVQFGASPSIAEAEKLAGKLVADGYPAYVVTAQIPGKGRYYRVRVGHFAKKVEADGLRASAASKQGLAGLVMPER